MLLIFIISLLAASPQDQAERLYDNAVTFMNAGKYQEALTDFETITASFSDTPWAPRAMLQMSTYYRDIEGNTSKALELLSSIQKNYATSQEAPAAYYYKAKIAEVEGQDPGALEAATSNLIRMENLFPGNDWASDARFLFASLSLRLDNYSQSLSYFQRLEFAEPNHAALPQALLLSAEAAYLAGQAKEAALILARLQARYPNSDAATIAARHLRLLDRFMSGSFNLRLDPTFFGGTPKRFSNPTMVHVSPNGRLAVLGNKSVDTANLHRGDDARSQGKGDIENFGHDRNGQLLIVRENRVQSYDGSRTFSSLTVAGETLRKIRSAAMDDYDRLYVVDADLRDVAAFDRQGQLIKRLGVGRAVLVRSFNGGAAVLDNDGQVLNFDASLNPAGTRFSGLSNIEDFCFDPYGNQYVLYDKGNAVAIFDFSGERVLTLNFKTQGFPMKQASGIAVDSSGNLYLSDRRGGAVYRFQ